MITVEIGENKKRMLITNCTESEYNQLKMDYTRKAEGYKFSPLYKKKIWDGNIEFISGASLPIGSYEYLRSICEKHKFDLKLNGVENLWDNEITLESFRTWCERFFADGIMPRDYQIEAAFNILKYRLSISELTTGGGKTLVCFMVFAYLFDTKKVSGKVLMIVPSVQLVLQGIKDFKEYNSEKLPIKVGGVCGGQKLKGDENIIIGTYQSLVKKVNEGSDLFEKTSIVVVDETHKLPAKSIKTVMEQLWHCDYRFGVTGTLPKEKSAEYLTLLEYLGPKVTDIKAKQLQELGYISSCKITQLTLDYATDEAKANLGNAIKYLRGVKKGAEALALERNFVIENEKRFNFIMKLIGKCTKNTLVLFHHIEYGKRMYERLKDIMPERNIYYIDGATAKETREKIIAEMNKANDGSLLVASYQTLSTGVSCNQISNVMFTESYKSLFMVIQSIGRALRLKDKEDAEKNKATIIDIVDDLRYGSVSNYTYVHAIERRRLYKQYEYPFTVKNIKF